MNETETPTALDGEASAAQIAQWKKQHGDVYAVKADGKVCYLKKPDRKVLSYAATLTNNPLKASETMLNNCWLGGCDDFKTDDALFLGVAQKLGALVQVKEAEISKL